MDNANNTANETTTLVGLDAIEYAREAGTLLNKYSDPVEGAREGLSVSEAEEIASEDASLIWVCAEVEEDDDDPTPFIGVYFHPNRLSESEEVTEDFVSHYVETTAQAVESRWPGADFQMRRELTMFGHECSDDIDENELAHVLERAFQKAWNTYSAPAPVDEEEA